LDRAALRRAPARQRCRRTRQRNEGRDYRAGIFDRHGRNVSSASGAAHVDPILQNYEREEVEEGDVFIWNDPFKSAGGLTHLPDLCVTQPVFWQGELVAYAQAYGHVTDIGGLAPGSVMIGATDIHQEGIIIPPVKLVSKGKIVEALYRTILNNSRYPADVQGDLDAEIMACRLGAARIEGLFERYGAATVDACFEELLERCARALREVAFPQIPDGEYPFEDFIEIAGAVPAEPRAFIKLKVVMIKKGDHVTFDFSDTDAQSKASINIAGDERYYTKYVVSIFRNLVPDTIFNGGAVRAISCKLGKRTVLSAEYPSSDSCRAFTLFRLPELCLGALGRSLDGQVPGSCDTRTSIVYATTNDDGERMIARDVLGGGGGGRPKGDGQDALNGNVAGRSVPAEFLEALYPVLVERDGLAPDSGGPGRHRGGLGCERVLRLGRAGTLGIRDDRLLLQPWGINGGQAGAGSTCVLNPATDAERTFRHKIDALPIEGGARLQVLTCGGGGWGDPLDRPADEVAEDVALGLVSAASARDDYGVVLDPAGTVAEPATAERRAALRNKSRATMFDRGRRFRDLATAGRIALTENM
jgi:N-methylhydantoinase B